MRRNFVALFYYSWIITLPLASVGGYLAYSAFGRFYTFNVRHATPLTPSLKGTLYYECTQFLQRLRSAYNLQFGGSALQTIELFASSSDLAVLESRMPQSGFRYIKARLRRGNDLLKAKIKYRGDVLYHWGYHKKSLRVKTSKAKLFEGMRSFNLLAPKFSEQLNNYLAYRLATELGLLSPRADLVRVTLNGENRGTHILVEQLTELTLRRSGLMPADIYRGEMIEKDAFTDSFVGNLFDAAGVWDKVSINNHYSADSMAPLERLLALVKDRDSAKAQAELSRLLDMEMWGRFSAFEALAQTKHFQADHNWRLYYDPWREQFSPMVWDPVGWAVAWRAKEGGAVSAEIIEHDLHKALFLNGDFVRARNRALRSFFSLQKDRTFLSHVADTIRIMSREVYLDPMLRPAMPGNVISAMKELERTIKRGFRDIQRQYSLDASGLSYNVVANRMLLVVNGKETVGRVRIRLNREMETAPTATVVYRGGQGDVVVAASGSMSLGAKSIVIDGGFLSNLAMVPSDTAPQSFRLHSSPGVYELTFGDLDLATDIADVSVDSGKGYEPIALGAKVKPVSFGHLRYPMSTGIVSKAETWSGDVVVTGHKVVAMPVVIEPGTRILMDVEALLVFENRLTAVGTGENPIRFVSRAAGQAPWGAVALQGPGADGSVLRYCQMSDGSGYKSDLVEYTGMLSIHSVQDVAVSNCRFANNHLVDDMVHVVYSKVRFDQSKWLGARGDALDLDLSTAVIVDSTIEGSGNDAIDLMTSAVQVIGSRLYKNRDKGISVGEGSSLFGVDNVIEGNGIGVQVKDGSIAILFNHTIINNGQALHAYRKNWRYGDGGDIVIAKSRIANSGRPIAADKNSDVYCFDSFVDVGKNGKRVSYVRADDQSQLTASEGDALPKAILESARVKELLGGLEPGAMERVGVNTRGAQPHG